ncbi:MAG: helix-turn-helix transcriptional regulator [Atopobiaceae bacterium]|nr:helix-turn-helix transcriptional regulator [Atopobiaceae bacterium]
MDEYTAFVKALGKRLKAMRKEADMTQDAFADHLGMSKSAYVGYEHGWHAMNVWQLRQTCEALGVDANDLLGLDGADDGVGGMEGE